MEVQRKSNISYEEFMEEHHNPGIPVVFTNASQVWRANGLFTPDWFRTHYPDKKGHVRNKETGEFYTMTEIMDLVEGSTVENPAPYPLLFNIPVHLPELMDLITPLNLNYAKPNWLEDKLFKRGYWGSAIELFVGGPGGKFPYVHKDYYHMSAWINQLYGEKRFTVFPRGQEEFLYVTEKNQWQSEVNIFEPDYEKHPKFKYATPISFTVGPGETLYIPFGLWHSAYSLTPTISVAFDQLNGKNFRSFANDVWHFNKGKGKVKAGLTYAYAMAAGLKCNMKDRMAKV